MLETSGAGFGIVGLAGLMQSAGMLNAADTVTSGGVGASPHFAARAKRVIFLMMNGAPSHVDTFDPKPALEKFAGTQPSGQTTKGTGFMPSPFEFRARGRSGVVMSELFPRLGACADDLCVIRSMHTDVPNHEPGLLMMQSGSQQPIRPCLGSWASYGLGSENQNLPAFVAIAPGAAGRGTATLVEFVSAGRAPGSGR